MSDQELKACPFCGYSAEIVKSRVKLLNTPYFFYPTCTTRDCIACVVEGDELGGINCEYQTEAAAIAAWNTRVNTSVSTDASDPDSKRNISEWLRRRAGNDLVMMGGKLAGQIADHIDSLESGLVNNTQEKPELPRVGSDEYGKMITDIFKERNYPCSPTAAARCGYEAARRFINQGEFYVE